MGVPHEDRHKIFDWSNRMIGIDDPEFEGDRDSGTEAAGELYMYANTLAAEKRKDPREDIISKLLGAEIEGDMLSETEFDMFFLLLSVAGNETTRNATAHGMRALMDNPDQFEKLVANPDLLPGAIEEILRWATPVMHFRRTALHDYEIGGKQIKQGDKVIMWHISANRDETVFDDPFPFDIERSPNEHIAFGGGGPHFCLGANLARMELRLVFDEVIRRMPDMTPERRHRIPAFELHRRHQAHAGEVLDRRQPHSLRGMPRRTGLRSQRSRRRRGRRRLDTPPRVGSTWPTCLAARAAGPDRGL